MFGIKVIQQDNSVLNKYAVIIHLHWASFYVNTFPQAIEWWPN